MTRKFSSGRLLLFDLWQKPISRAPRTDTPFQYAVLPFRLDVRPHAHSCSSRRQDSRQHRNTHVLSLTDLQRYTSCNPTPSTQLTLQYRRHATTPNSPRLLGLHVQSLAAHLSSRRYSGNWHARPRRRLRYKRILPLRFPPWPNMWCIPRRLPRNQPGRRPPQSRSDDAMRILSTGRLGSVFGERGDKLR